MAVQHLALPLRVTSLGRFATVEQDSDQEIAQNAAVILATPIGSRVEVPEFGAPQATFGPSPDIPGMVAAIQEWEPRADLDVQVAVNASVGEGLLAIKALVSQHV